MTTTNLAKIVVKGINGKYLILRSSEWPENPARSLQPDLPGGVVEPGETPEVGVTRELMEEAGIAIAISDLQLVYNEPEEHDGKKFQRYIYFTELKNEQDITLSWEHDKFWWMTASEVLDMKIREPYASIFNGMADLNILV